MEPASSRSGFTLIELLVVISIILVILAVAIPRVDKQLQLTRETAVIREIGTIKVAETQYNAQFGRYAMSLAQLGPPLTGADDAEAANLIPKTLADGKKNGYVYSVKAMSTGYAITAAPDAISGRTFYSDQSLIIRNSIGPEPATVTSPPIQ